MDKNSKIEINDPVLNLLNFSLDFISNIQKSIELRKNNYHLLLFYEKLIELLDAYNQRALFTNELNRNYLRLCNKIGNILEKSGFEELAKNNWQPYETLRSPNEQDPITKYSHFAQWRLKKKARIY